MTNAACYVIILTTALVYTNVVAKAYAQFECHAGLSLAACDWLEEKQ